MYRMQFLAAESCSIRNFSILLDVRQLGALGTRDHCDAGCYAQDDISLCIMMGSAICSFPTFKKKFYSKEH